MKVFLVFTLYNWYMCTTPEGVHLQVTGFPAFHCTRVAISICNARIEWVSAWKMLKVEITFSRYSAIPLFHILGFTAFHGGIFPHSYLKINPISPLKQVQLYGVTKHKYSVWVPFFPFVYKLVLKHLTSGPYSKGCLHWMVQLLYLKWQNCTLLSYGRYAAF